MSIIIAADYAAGGADNVVACGLARRCATA